MFRVFTFDKVPRRKDKCFFNAFENTNRLLSYSQTTIQLSIDCITRKLMMIPFPSLEKLPISFNPPGIFYGDLMRVWPFSIQIILEGRSQYF